MDDKKDIQISVGINVLCKTQEEVLKATEVLTRAAVAISLDRSQVSITLTPFGEDD